MKTKKEESTVPAGDYLEMYKMLHEERVLLAEEARKLEMAAITAVAALYAWLATQNVSLSAVVYRGAARYARGLPSRCPGRKNPLHQKIPDAH